MRIDVNMTKEETKFTVGHWWASDSMFALGAFRAQLQSAAVIFPDLAEFEIVKRAGKKRGGEKGGHARAASLSPERRSEIASKAATKRWGEK